ncbi:exopolysaccharide biosynthesis protein [Neisseriaceae bacterium B2N2-7]|uniref:Exopolysaccharide biosynthesis protein n=2 Tax=Craterilacuibacter sinensis TaxID=2686017 RepID=A0A845BPK4_9NEIS|nr:exopolysaccharide biosynthesis protein [Craterilacuibacter sinensis]
MAYQWELKPPPRLFLCILVSGSIMPQARRSALWPRILALPAPQSGQRVADALGRQPRQQLDRIALLALPMLIPVALPGMSTTLGLITVALALAHLRQRPLALPGFIAERALPDVLVRGMDKLQTRLFGWLPHVSRPRWRALSGSRMRAGNTLMLGVAGLALLTPVPMVSFDNVIPAAAIVLLTLGLRVRDGALLAAGYGMTLLGAASTAAMWWGLSVAGQAGVAGATDWLQRL